MLMKQEDINNRLADVPLFKELSDEELEPFINIAISRTINHLIKKNYIHQREDGLYLIDREALEQELFY
jgi:hypothetical protein